MGSAVHTACAAVTRASVGSARLRGFGCTGVQSISELGFCRPASDPTVQHASHVDQAFLSSAELLVKGFSIWAGCQKCDAISASSECSECQATGQHLCT